MKTNNFTQSESQQVSGFVLVLFEAFILIGSFFYIQLFADSVARYTGYKVAIYLVPVILAIVCTVILSKVVTIDKTKLSKLIIISCIASITPVSVFNLLVNYSSGPM
ncbi:hypothetical protein GCM10008107_04870 [Psychrosphaera saromensis]|uniref:Uncharacterized protein n=1 Tax=Psychrosphaera saromensis TaxID=716813 RepID=A0A2S7UX97_9GAMM|nr:hypothetical protein [Psychrosphaera saromensis]PQJ54577.1 hypothetical protein BTO11_13590 [Psychrosphaera saromensis]GHB58829.1 hypothetical protein GCM10008107_04870 [Psychrosphaera saromensis]GLQ14208.1 hypothetical protein GCM10007917_16630 [Psychrosphaera saromensis]